MIFLAYCFCTVQVLKSSLDKSSLEVCVPYVWRATHCFRTFIFIYWLHIVVNLDKQLNAWFWKWKMLNVDIKDLLFGTLLQLVLFVVLPIFFPFWSWLYDPVCLHMLYLLISWENLLHLHFSTRYSTLRLPLCKEMSTKGHCYSCWLTYGERRQVLSFRRRHE